MAKNNASTIRSLPLTKLLSDDVRHFFPGHSDVIWFHELGRNKVLLDKLDGRTTESNGYFSSDALVGLDRGATVVYSQLQLAYYMGIREVYLMGLDFSFSVPTKTVRTDECGYETALESSGERNHFHPDYRKPGEVWAVPRLDCQELAFRLAHEQFMAAGGVIYNASRQTKLEVFPRVELDEVLKVRSV